MTADELREAAWDELRRAKGGVPAQQQVHLLRGILAALLALGGDD